MVAEQTISVTWEHLGLTANQSFSGRDVWEHKGPGRPAMQFSAPVTSHGVAMITWKRNVTRLRKTMVHESIFERRGLRQYYPR